MTTGLNLWGLPGSEKPMEESKSRAFSEIYSPDFILKSSQGKNDE